MANENVLPRRLPLQLLEEMTNGFSDDRLLGSGAYGKVYLGVYKDGQKIAVKILFDVPGHGDAQFDKEFDNLSSLRHENIVRLVGYCHETMRECVLYNGKKVLADVTKRALCFEFMERGSLDKYLSDESSGLNWSVRYTLIKGICNGLKYLHEELKPPIYHLDLKPANILLDETMIPKIADFGLSRFFGEERSHITTSPIGTLGYLPPEYVNKNIISKKLDIFSLGVVIVKIIAGPAGHTNSAEMSTRFIEIVSGNWGNRLQSTSGDSSDSCLEQVKRCITIALNCMDDDRRKRPTIGDILKMLNESETTENDQGALIDQFVQMEVSMSSRIDHEIVHMEVDESRTEHVDSSSSEEDVSDDGNSSNGDSGAESHNMCNDDEDSNTRAVTSSCMVKETELINVHPLPLHFHFQPNKYITCPVHITNNMDGNHVAVRFVWKGYGRRFLANVDSLQGLMPPKSTYTFIATIDMGGEQRLDKEELSNIAIESCLWEVGDYWDEVREEVRSFFARCKDENRCEFHELTVRAISTKTYETVTSEPIRPAIKVVRDQPGENFSVMTTMDVHPSEPWVMACYEGGYVAIWNYVTEARVITLTLTPQRADTRSVDAWSAKFVPQMQLIVFGDRDGYIHVYSCTNTSTCVLTKKAHEDGITSLAVHPTQPLVLSASHDRSITLWDCKKDWACIHTVVGHSDWVMDVKFSPHDSNTFASAAQDSTVKIWSILSSEPAITLDCKEDEYFLLCYVDYYPTSTEGDQQHYMVTGGEGTARIWDLQTMKCVHKIAKQKHVGVFDCLRDRPVLFGVSVDDSVSLRDSTTYRIESTVHFGLGEVHSYAYIKDIRSLAVGHEYGIAIMKID